MMRLIFMALFYGLICPSVMAEGEFENRLREAELAGNREQVRDICREWYASGQFSQGVLSWNYNALMSVEPDAMLITQSDADTYPIWLLQNALDIRADVPVINLQLVENQVYQAHLLSRLGFSSSGKVARVADFLNELIAKSAVRPLYFGVLLDKKRLDADKSKLFLTGLAFRYSDKPFDNVAALRYNFEHSFMTDYLKLDLALDKSPEVVARLNLNYIPAMLILYRHYQVVGEATRAQTIKELAFRVGKRSSRETEVSTLFNGSDLDASVVVTSISTKTLDKQMKKVGERLFAAETETTNGEYELFLQDLLRNKAFDMISTCKTSKTDWRSLLPASFNNLADDKAFAHYHPDKDGAPVQQVSYEAATQYCAWLTKGYNSSSEKKKYKKVLFRLPTEQEWTMAASAGVQKVNYPWGGDAYRNAKGCYLGNFFSTEPCADCAEKGESNDGGFFPVKADSYFPNSFGLYCISGNVAEMTSTQGIAKGGSWEDKPQDCAISSRKQYTANSPAIGFRVFMEVIEE